MREPAVLWIYSKRPSSYCFTVLVVLVSLLRICVAPEASSERVRQCESYGPRAKRFVLVGTWTEGQEQRVEPEGRDACEQVRTLGAAAATRAFIWCGCSLLLNASESTSAHSGVRMLITARRLLPPHGSTWRARRAYDLSHSLTPHMSAVESTEHKELLKHVRMLRSQQARTDCQDARALVVHLEHLPNLGAALQLMNAALSFAAMTQRILVMADHDRWAMIDAGACASRSWACLFEPLAACSEERLGSASFHPLVLNTKHSWRAHDGARVLHARAAYELFVALGVHAYGAAVGCTRNKVESQQCALTWTPLPPHTRDALPMWRASLAAELFRPAPRMLRIVRATALRIGFEDAQTVACHIRRSDKVAGQYQEAHVTPAAVYIEHLRALLAHHAESGFSRLLIATDDDEALRDAVAAGKRRLPQMRAVFDQNERRDLRAILLLLNYSEMNPDSVAARTNRSAIAEDAITNMALLVSSQALVGTWSSAFGKVAQYTRAGRALLFCSSSGISSLLSDEAGVGGPGALTPQHVQVCAARAQLYVSVDESPFAEFDPL